MTTPTIRFNAALRASKGRAILELPEAASKRLPSRGQVAVQGTINGHTFRTVLEPDGNRGHWMNVDKALHRAAGVSADDTATVELEPIKEWPEPNVPADLRRALSAAPPEIRDLWEAITPMARREWVRWVNATKNSDTRKRRVEVRPARCRHAVFVFLRPGGRRGQRDIELSCP